MSNATVSSSGKTQSGTLHSLGGTDFDDYYANLTTLFQGEPENVESVIDEFKATILPASAGFQQASAAINHGFPGSSQINDQQQHEPRQGAGTPPGQQTVCPSHGQPATWQEGGISQRTGKAYSGFWKCPVTRESISNFNGHGLKAACPASKQ